jgi:hypothetical protein
MCSLEDHDQHAQLCQLDRADERVAEELAADDVDAGQQHHREQRCRRHVGQEGFEALHLDPRKKAGQSGLWSGKRADRTLGRPAGAQGRSPRRAPSAFT